MIRNKIEKREIVLDLTGPDGNAYALMGYARDLAKQLGIDHELIINEMKSGDYDNLVLTFDRYFGRIVTLER
jgi:hypothetical protein